MTRDAAPRPLLAALLLAVLVALGVVGGTTIPAPHPADRHTAAATGTPARTDHGRRAITADAAPTRAATAASTWHVDLAPAPMVVAGQRILAAATVVAPAAPAAARAASPVDARAPPGATA